MKLRDIIQPMYYDSTSLKFKRLNGWFFLITATIFITAFIIGWIFSSKNEIEKRNHYNEEEKIMVIKNGDDFSEEKMILFIKELNFRYPELVYAQGVLESGADFNSVLNNQNNNYFGMRVAHQRINTQSGEQDGYAYYNNWRNSVIDYAIFTAMYLGDFESKEQYYKYIEKRYAESPGYIEKVKALEQQYLEKLVKITEKSSYDIYVQFNDSVPAKIKKKKADKNNLEGKDTLNGF